jgi:hypothetical protein
MRKQWLWMMAVMLGLAGLSSAALVTGDTLDQMKDESLWYGSGGNYGFGRNWELNEGKYDTLDPYDHYINSLKKSDTDPNWYSYKTEDGLVFESAAATFGNKYYGSISLAYKIDGGSAVSMDPTSVENLGGPGTHWFSYVYTWDFSSLSTKPDEVILTLTSSQSWSATIATTKLTTTEIPEPATLSLLAAGGLMTLRRRKK